jgi:hypothetical protein
MVKAKRSDKSDLFLRTSDLANPTPLKITRPKSCPSPARRITMMSVGELATNFIVGIQFALAEVKSRPASNLKMWTLI